MDYKRKCIDSSSPKARQNHRPAPKLARQGSEVLTRWVLIIDATAQPLELLLDGTICLNYRRVGGAWNFEEGGPRLPDKYILTFHWDGSEQDARTYNFQKIPHTEAFMFSEYNTAVCRTDRQFLLPWQDHR